MACLIVCIYIGIRTCMYVYNSYTMAVKGFADTYTRSPRATGQRDEGVYISKIPSSHGIN